MERNTVQKALVLQTVRSMKDHPSAEDVYARVSAICPNISKATVYRGLNKFADDGEILRIPVANAPDRYDFRVENHAHCLCSVCGRLFDYYLKELPEIDAVGSNGFKATGVSVIVNGICKDCREKQNKKKENMT